MIRLASAVVLGAAAIVGCNAAAQTRWASPVGVLVVLYAVVFCFVEDPR